MPSAVQVTSSYFELTVMFKKKSKPIGLLAWNRYNLKQKIQISIDQWFLMNNTDLDAVRFVLTTDRFKSSDW